MTPVLVALIASAAPLSFEETLSLADRSPAALASLEAVRQRKHLGAQVSALAANPQFQLQPGVRASGTRTGPEVVLGVAQSFNLAGLHPARQQALAEELKQDEALAESVRRSVRARAAASWLSLWASQAALKEAKAELDLADDWVGRIDRAAADGALTRADAAAARSWRAEARLAMLAAEGEAFSFGVKLNEALGREDFEPSVAHADLPTITLGSEEGLSAAAAQRAPEVQSATHARDAERARADELAALNGTWLQLGVQGSREGTGDSLGLATLQLTVPLFDRGERDRSRLEAAAQHAEGARREALARATALRLDARHEVEHTQETLAVIAAELVPAAEDAARFAQRRMERGEGTAFEWVLARRAALAARIRHVHAHSQHVLARFVARELADASGGPR